MIFGFVSKSDLILRKGDIVIPARGNSIGWATIIEEEQATCTQTTIKLNKHMSYEQIVAKLIRVRYTSDEEIALINNALLDLSNISNNDEYNEYQSWRTKCKEVAKNYINKNEEVK